MAHVCVGAWGIAYTSWKDSFYPDDLPEDWRFDYYSGSQRCVAINPADWPSLIEAGEAEASLEALPEGFHLYFAFEDHAALADWLARTPEPPSVQGLLVAAEHSQDLTALKVLSLSSSLPLWVWPRGGIDHAEVRSAGLDACWSESTVEGECVSVGVIELAEPADLRAQRASLERFASCCGKRGDLLLSPDSAARGSEGMGTLTTLCELMGY